MRGLHPEAGMCVTDGTEAFKHITASFNSRKDTIMTCEVQTRLVRANWRPLGRTRDRPASLSV